MEILRPFLLAGVCFSAGCSCGLQGESGWGAQRRCWGNGVSPGGSVVCIITRQSPSGAAKPRIWHTNHGSRGCVLTRCPCRSALPLCRAGGAGEGRQKPPEILAFSTIPVSPRWDCSCGGQADLSCLAAALGQFGHPVPCPLKPACNAGKATGPCGSAPLGGRSLAEDLNESRMGPPVLLEVPWIFLPPQPCSTALPYPPSTSRPVGCSNECVLSQSNYVPFWSGFKQKPQRLSPNADGF